MDLAQNKPPYPPCRVYARDRGFRRNLPYPLAGVVYREVLAEGFRDFPISAMFCESGLGDIPDVTSDSAGCLSGL